MMVACERRSDSLRRGRDALTSFSLTTNLPSGFRRATSSLSRLTGLGDRGGPGGATLAAGASPVGVGDALAGRGDADADESGFSTVWTGGKHVGRYEVKGTERGAFIICLGLLRYYRVFRLEDRPEVPRASDVLRGGQLSIEEYHTTTPGGVSRGITQGMGSAGLVNLDLPKLAQFFKFFTSAQAKKSHLKSFRGIWGPLVSVRVMSPPVVDVSSCHMNVHVSQVSAHQSHRGNSRVSNQTTLRTFRISELAGVCLVLTQAVSQEETQFGVNWLSTSVRVRSSPLARGSQLGRRVRVSFGVLHGAAVGRTDNTGDA